MGSFVSELRRRNVFRVGIAYAVVGWLVAQVGDLAADNLAFPDWFMPMVLVVLALGFPLALIFSWAFEVTPEGLKKSKDVEVEASVTGATGQKLNYIIAGALILALGFIAWQNLGSTPDPASEQEPGDALIAAADKSIAVLPFVSMSSGEDDGYFADGLTEEILNSLAQIADLKVAGRTSSFYYKGKTPSFQEVGEALGVAHVLEGSVRRSGDTIRVTAQLIRADNGFHLWSDTFDRASSDIFAIQDDIAMRVTEALKVTLLGEEIKALARHGTDNAEAQSLYLIALAKLRESDTFGSDPIFTRGHFAPARLALERAVELDPEYAEGWAALSLAYMRLGANMTSANSAGLSWDEASRLAIGAADRALALVPDLPEALAAKSIALETALIERGEADLSPAHALLDRALELAPDNLDILQAMAFRLLSTGSDYEAAIALYDRALALDPLSQLRLSRAGAMDGAGRHKEARAEFLAVAELYPDAPWKAGIAEMEAGRGHLHHYILWVGDAADADLHAFAWASLGDLEKALEIEREFAAVGGQVGAQIRGGMFLFGRDYQGFLDFMTGSPSNVEALGPLQVSSWKMIADVYLRDWPAAMKSWEAYRQAFPEWAGSQYGDADGRARVAGYGTGFRMRIAHRAAWTAYVHQLAGRQSEADAIWSWSLDIADMDGPRTVFRTQERHISRALVHAGRGEKSEALDELEAAYEAGWRHLMGGKAVGNIAGDIGWFEDSPLLDSIREEPRYIAFIEKVKAANAAMLAELNAGLTLEDIMDEK